jgi:hypothetical protein
MGADMIGRRKVLWAAAAFSVAGSSSVLAQDAIRLRDELLRLETQSWQDTKGRNVAGLRPYLADEAFLIFYDGARLDKEAFLKAVAREFTIHSFSIAPGGTTVMPVTQDVAILLYRVTYTSASGKAKPVTATVAASNTYVRRDGRWRSMLYQETETR